MTNVPLILQSKSIDNFLLYERDIGRYRVNRYTVYFKDVAKKSFFQTFFTYFFWFTLFLLRLLSVFTRIWNKNLKLLLKLVN